MLALPIVGMSAIDLTVRSAELSPDQRMTRELGAADARISPSGLAGPIYQHPNGEQYAPVGGYDKYRPGKAQDRPPLKSALPPGIRATEDVRGHAKVHTAHGLLQTDLRELDVHDPLTRGLVTLDRGRMPRGPGEVVATNAFLEASGLHVGSSATPRGSPAPYRIVGSYEMPDKLSHPELLALPGTLLAPLDKALTATGAPPMTPRTTYLVAVGGDGFTWNMVKAANTRGALVLSRTVFLHRPADSEVPLFEQQPKEQLELMGGEGKLTERAVLVTVVGLAMLEICLLAGPAFAVGARRSRRQLGLVGANGGDRRHIRAVVLSGGLVIGAVAAVAGTAIGVALTVGLRPLLEEKLGARFGGFEVRPLELLGIALVAVVTGLLAALVPAVTASRQTVLASLTGRRGVRRANRVLPVLGLLAVAGGAAIALYGTRFRVSPTLVMGGSAIAELGIVALTPVLVGLFGRLGRWLPLSPRLALRDAVRNRGRTAPAVAAVLAAVAGTVAVSTYQHSREVQYRHEYTAALPDNAGYLTSGDPSGHKDVPALRDAVSKNLPVAVRADVDRLVVGSPNCSERSAEPGCGRVAVIVPKEQRCPLSEAEHGASAFPPERIRELRQDPRCKVRTFGAPFGAPFDIVVADEKLMEVLAIGDPGSAAALKAGRPVSFDRNQVKDGKVTLRIVTDAAGAEEASAKRADPPGQDRALAVHQAPDTTEAWGVQLVLPPAAARAAGLATAPAGAYFSLDGKASSQQRQRLDGEVDRMGADAQVEIEEGYQEQSTLGLLALSVFAGLVTIGAAGIATGLAQADSEADLKTLAAVGAAPRVRRTLSGFQCGVVALMGVVLGSAAGILPAVGLRLTQKREELRLIENGIDMGYTAVRDTELYVPIAVPWGTLAGLLVLVPLGAALLAALVTKSSGALARRTAG
ncbi:FtsX-like permease family protein [Streptomyces sp. NBC_00091]|uniref:FtsX-like permease family protein n=1 Tax=Streptomyces sp. NBC_00091 TaxID=2975648 RepID=UPI0022520725|nr:FtsX-like permease family protein [Streptomyces sp. NBC_00091]MCX5377270.1 FtsX-like permease family protein [Streptomyces sp. NBC_00091]